MGHPLHRRPRRQHPALPRHRQLARRRRRDDLVPPPEGHARHARRAGRGRDRMGSPGRAVLRGARVGPAPRPPAAETGDRAGSARSGRHGQHRQRRRDGPARRPVRQRRPLGRHPAVRRGPRPAQHQEDRLLPVAPPEQPAHRCRTGPRDRPPPRLSPEPPRQQRPDLHQRPTPTRRTPHGDRPSGPDPAAGPPPRRGGRGRGGPGGGRGIGGERANCRRAGCSGGGSRRGLALLRPGHRAQPRRRRRQVGRHTGRPGDPSVPGDRLQSLDLAAAAGRQGRGDRPTPRPDDARPVRRARRR